MSSKFIPISIYSHIHKGLDFEFRITHDPCDTEEAAKVAANPECAFGLFIDEAALPERKLMFAMHSKDGSIQRVPRSRVKGYYLNPSVAAKLGDPIDVSTEEGKAKATEALVTMDPAYMVSDNDYVEDPAMTTPVGMQRIAGAIEVTPSRPLFFESIAYKIEKTQ